MRFLVQERLLSFKKAKFELFISFFLCRSMRFLIAREAVGIYGKGENFP
jgi:hypothetical protein